MFSRFRPLGERRHLRRVETSAAARPRVLATPGRVDGLASTGKLDAVLQSGAWFAGR